ncbi:hypothetical protein ACK1X7_30995 [Streptomyces sp. CY1]|uniref:hypothetical protein n=1 Tax=Streptomyces sp. CY1 TaxID=3388313 RepID=UPI00399FF88E
MNRDSATTLARSRASPRCSCRRPRTEAPPLPWPGAIALVNEIAATDVRACATQFRHTVDAQLAEAGLADHIRLTGRATGPAVMSRDVQRHRVSSRLSMAWHVFPTK